MSITSEARLSRVIAYIGYIAIFASGVRSGFLPSHDVSYLGVLLMLSLTVLYVADAWIRRRHQVHTHLDFSLDAQGKVGWLMIAILLLIGFFLDGRVKQEQFFQPWLYATIVFFWAAAAISSLKYFRRTK